MTDLTCPSCNTTDVTVLRVRAGTRWKRTSFYCAHCSLLSSQQEPVTQEVFVTPTRERPIIPLASTDPLNPIFAAEDKLTQQVDDDGVYVTVYWLDANDKYATVGWPVPMFLIDNLDHRDINLRGSESLRLWL